MVSSSITRHAPPNNLQGISDQCVNMYEHVTSECRAAYYHLKNIHCLKACLTQEACITVVRGFLTSRIY
jgi:hypothetical protein